MFKFLVTLAFLANVAAFAPAGRVARSTSVKMGYEDAAGVIPPTGFFDPLGMFLQHYYIDKYVKLI